LITQIDEKNFYLAPIIGIDCARGIENGNAVLMREAGARAHLGLESFWYFKGYSSRNKSTLSGLERQGIVI
jgi:hypothetical protein